MCSRGACHRQTGEYECPSLRFAPDTEDGVIALTAATATERDGRVDYAAALALGTALGADPSALAGLLIACQQGISDGRACDGLAMDLVIGDDLAT